MSRAPRTLAVRLDSAGDVLLAGPALRALAAGSEHLTLGRRVRDDARLVPALLPVGDGLLLAVVR